MSCRSEHKGNFPARSCPEESFPKWKPVFSFPIVRPPNALSHNTNESWDFYQVSVVTILTNEYLYRMHDTTILFYLLIKKSQPRLFTTSTAGLGLRLKFSVWRPKSLTLGSLNEYLQRKSSRMSLKQNNSQIILNQDWSILLSSLDWVFVTT